MTDLVQVDIDTALVMYSMGETHIRCLQRDVFSDDWTNMQPLYLDEILNGLTIFVSDKRRAELLNPPKTDIKTMKEDIAMEYQTRFRIDPEEDEEDDDPDWVEEPAQVEAIPDDDAIPEHERIPYEKPEVLTVEQVTAKTDKPPKWNILRVNKLSNEGWSDKQIAEEYGVSEDTVRIRLMHYRSKS